MEYNLFMNLDEYFHVYYLYYFIIYHIHYYLNHFYLLNIQNEYVNYHFIQYQKKIHLIKIIKHFFS